MVFRLFPHGLPSLQAGERSFSSSSAASESFHQELLFASCLEARYRKLILLGTGTRYCSVPELGTAQYRNSVLELGITWYRGVPSDTERVPSGTERVPRDTERYREARGSFKNKKIFWGAAPPWTPGISDIKHRSLINILINNPYGTMFLRSVEASDQVKNAEFIFQLLDNIVDEVGEYLVVQVVTDNASAYKAAGKKLMEKRKHLYWTSCAAHCINLILEKLGELPQHKNALTKAKKITKFIYNHSWVLALMRKFSKKEILRPAATRFATAYLTLESMLDARQPLEAMFTSTQWLSCAWAKKAEGKEIRKIVLNDRFWQSVLYAITTTRPLVQVLRMVDAEKKPAMGFIYNAMDEAKEMIASNLGGEEGSFREIWNIIDDRWEQQLHRHLHAAGYYINPQYQYAENKSTNPEIKLGLYHCMDRLISDATERSNADMQLVPFRNKESFFWITTSKGYNCQTISRNWSTYNQIHTKRRNRLSTLRMNSLVYIMYNRRLRDRNLKKKGLMDHEDPLLCEDVASDDEWFIDDEVEVMSSELQYEDLNVDFFDGLKASTSTTIQEQNKKGKRKITEIEEGVDWETLDSIEEEGVRAVHHNDDSNEDPLSDDSADDL
ncbi:hypothetical protein M5K25_016912 [Dendrobium thyrsiflorum]|uniref:DUF659 domain-containing protein n=1 Tax=Dendrobium thyrsiflorum TaxID=117978 RepID=A0ABD0UL02_DENTH